MVQYLACRLYYATHYCLYYTPMRRVYLVILLYFVCIHVTAQDYKPRKLIVSIDSLCLVAAELEEDRFFQRHKYPDTTAVEVARGVTDFISNIVQAVASEHGFRYVPNYRKETHVKSDIQLCMRLSPVRNAYDFLEGGKVRQSVFVMEIVYGKNRELLISDQSAFEVEGTASKPYSYYFEEVRRCFWWRRKSGFRLFNLANPVREFDYHSSDKVTGMNQWIKAEKGIAPELTRELTLAVEQSIMNALLIEKESGREAREYAWAGNYRKSIHGRKSLDYIYTFHLEQPSLEQLKLKYHIHSSSGESLRNGELELTPSLLKNGNYVELIRNARGLLVY